MEISNFRIKISKNNKLCSCQDNAKEGYCEICMEEIIAEKMMTTDYLGALMQEPFIQEHIKIIPVGFDVTEQERFWHTRHYEEGGNAYNRHTD
jgi:hypothetical protein